MKLKEVTPNDGDVFIVGAGTVTYIDGWWVGSQRITDDMFDIIGELEINEIAPDSNGTPVKIGNKYTLECKVDQIDTDDSRLNVQVVFNYPGRKMATWVNSTLLHPSEA